MNTQGQGVSCSRVYPLKMRCSHVFCMGFARAMFEVTLLRHEKD
jgi:hypothetical protein